MIAIVIRGVCWILFAAGLLLGAAADRVPSRTPPMRGGYLVLAGDFHVHSFPGDGALPPWEIAHEAQRRRLDVVALTNHNATLSWRLGRLLNSNAGTSGVLLLPGDEVTSVGFHMAAVGFDRPVPWRGSIEDVAAAVHGRGGVAIVAHPAVEQSHLFDAAAFRALDGIELAYPGMIDDRRLKLDLNELYRAAIAAHPSIAAIGSSDFHTWAPIGVCRTYLFVRTADGPGVLEALRAGRTVACDGKGVTHGPANLLDLVRDDCRADMSALVAGEGSVSRAGGTLVWLSLIGLVLLGAEEPASR
ncbi:MAG TPA: CehA/McbA family metallohydrolase [Vicinamibacterales bacterium]